MSERAVIELAPNHKVGLALTNPVMPAAGCFGLGTEYARLVELEALGAVVVGPVTAGPRKGIEPPRTLPVPGGVLLHTGLVNPGVSAAVRRYARAWARLPVPVVVHVAGTSPGEAASCCRRLASVEAVVGIELGLPDTASGSAGPVKALDDVIAIVQAAREALAPRVRAVSRTIGLTAETELQTRAVIRGKIKIVCPKIMAAGEKRR